MIESLLTKFSDRFISKWLILVFDVFIVLFTYPVAVFIKNNFDILLMQHTSFGIEVALIIGLTYLLSFLFNDSYKGVIRQTGLRDAFLIFKASTFGFAALLLITYLLDSFKFIQVDISRNTLVLHYLLTLLSLLAVRFMIKSAYLNFKKSTNGLRRIRVLIFGSGAMGELTRQTLLKEVTKNYEVIAFLDDNPSKNGKLQDGIPVYKPELALKKEFIQSKRIHQLIIAVQNLSLERRKQLIEVGMELGLKVKVVPPAKSWIQGALTSKQIKNVRIEDLLEREPITLDSTNVNKELNGKVILITGAAGSIGSEILRQVIHYKPKKLIALDQAESALYDLSYEIKTTVEKLGVQIEYIVADITNEQRMNLLFSKYKPQIVFHAAAYKHVPLMEDHPYEAVRVNVFGTKLLADLSVEYAAHKFVMVSTDKAVNPTNVMGATKRIAEMYVQSLSQCSSCATLFVTTRFGNVLGSNGSVIPLFKKQIEAGGPITITHPEITRYFMTIPEACNLVLEAGAMGNGGEIFVFDMGESVKIVDLAKKMIKLSGLTLGKDIEIVFTGLRPGEKLYEELLADKENNLPTHHPKIMKAKNANVDFEMLTYQLKNLEEKLQSGDDFSLVGAIKQIVQEYKSNNSVYSKLDK
ncbi:capsular polysaccharide biosynthesis protein [Thermaurantimonas aggregans]|uniref:Capsular polysaccharide biosynthesis protein n=1 Tax=Thermaurantimonas aggregans TaxID=2173829 RepID=A0A401XIP8_9FLAO|nr:nucleoside-diphosphate sugar epimerase/dehydratase [Thermaurantimonas aggregans]GCD76890.1 capsular polysaccharide biosynthesis protein [Thermaurantimonas aggregans]